MIWCKFLFFESSYRTVNCCDGESLYILLMNNNNNKLFEGDNVISKIDR